MDLNYDLQAEIYLEGASKITGIEHEQFGFIVFHLQEKPYDIEVFIADEDFIESGKRKLKAATKLYLEGLWTGLWPPNHADEVQVLSPTFRRLKQMDFND